MVFESAIKNIEIPSSCVILTDEFGYWNFNIDFVNTEGEYDQTQLDVLPYQFDYIQRKCKELSSLWKDFCKENGFRQNSITGISLANL
jgi:hypothetical protein